MIEWLTIAGVIGKAVAGPMTKEIMAAGKAKLFPGELEKAVIEGIHAAGTEDETLPPSQHLFYHLDTKEAEKFLKSSINLPATVLELRKPLEQEGTPRIDCLMLAWSEIAQELSLNLNEDNLQRWIKTFVEKYFQKTSAITAFSVAREQYLKALVNSCNDIKFVGIDAAVRESDRSSHLLEIFVVPTVTAEEVRSIEQIELEQNRLRDITGSDDLFIEERYRLERNRFIPILADQLFYTQNRVVLLGDPGSGKTTLLRYYAVKLAQGKSAELGLANNDHWLPILIYMRDWAKNSSISLFSHLYDFSENTLHVTLPQGFFEYWWQGRSLVLLDGLDEVIDESIRSTLVNKLVCVLESAQQNAVVITSRPWGYRRDYFRTESFPHFNLLPFDDAQIQEFVENWYSSRNENSQKARSMVSNLQESLATSDRVKQLVANPLLLTIVVLIHRYQDDLPKRRHQLYDKAVNTLLKSWDRTGKGLTEQQKSFFKVLDRDDDLRKILSVLAKWIHSQYISNVQSGGTLIREKELLEELSLIIMQKGIEPDRADQEAKRFISFIRDRSGLINEYGQGLYGFVHKTFQEYLTAEAIQKETRYDFPKMLSFVRDKLHHQHWREVVLLLVCQQEEIGAAQLVETIAEAGSNYEKWLHRDLLLAAECLTEDPMDLKIVGCKTVQNIISQLVALVAASHEIVGIHVQQRARKLLHRMRNTAFQQESLLAVEKWAGSINWIELSIYRFHLSQEKNMISELSNLLLDSYTDTNARLQAINGLGYLGNYSDEVKKTLLLLLHDSNQSIRVSAVSVLGQFTNNNDVK